MKYKTSVSVLLVGSTMLLTGWAGVIPGRWEKVESLAPGTDLIIMLDSGDSIEGAFLSSDAQSIRLGVSTGSERTFSKSSVSRVISVQKIDDRLLNGALIGAGVGFAGGFLALTAYNSNETASGSIWGTEAMGFYVGAGLLGAGVGAATGALIDKLHKKSEEFYRSR